MSPTNKTKLMGILNLTDDSFSDGGKYIDTKDAIDHAKSMIEDGADIIDIGAESTRPGFKDVDTAIQLERILPVIQKIRKDYNYISVSVDTRSSVVAKEALDTGASIINDVSSGTYDTKIMRIVAESKAKIILTHMPKSHQEKEVSESDDQFNLHRSHPLEDIKQYLNERITFALSQGIKKNDIIVDPGICYGKSGEDNIEIIKNIQYFVKNFKNVCLGVSNKKFSSSLFRGFKDDELSIASLAVTTHCVINGVSYLRVHDIVPNRDALEVAWKTHAIT